MTMTTEQFFDELNKMFGSKPIRNAVANDGIPRKDWSRHLQLIKELKDDQDENYVHKEDALEYVMDNMGDDWITDTEIYQDLLTDNESLGDQDKELKKERDDLRERVDGLRKQNQELREELDEKEDWVDTNDIAQYWTTPLYEEITTLKKKAMDSAFRSARQIQRLKKAISELEGSK